MRLSGQIPAIEPGERTAAHIDHALSRTTVLAAAYLTVIFLLPEILSARTNVPFYLGGTSLLVAVCAILDLQAQILALNRRGDGPQ